jgi:uncharacterized protein YxeA
MKKGLRSAIIIAAILIILAGAVCVYLNLDTSRLDKYHVSEYSSQQTDNGVNATFTKLNGHRTILTFSAEAGDTVTVEYDAAMEGGAVIIMDPKYRVIGKLPTDGADSVAISIEKGGRHLVRLTGNNAKGHIMIHLLSDRVMEVGYSLRGEWIPIALG